MGFIKMEDLFPDDPAMYTSTVEWQPPEILEKGKIEARLFSDEPDPFGP